MTDYTNFLLRSLSAIFNMKKQYPQIAQIAQI